MILPFSGSVLPPGEHPATIDEIENRFAHTPHRRQLFAGLKLLLGNLKAAGARRAWLNGSFVTDKTVPDDYDLCWDPNGVNPDLLDPILLDLSAPRFAQHVKYGGDIFPNVTEQHSVSLFLDFFQVDKTTGGPKGIIVIDLLRFNP